MADSPRRFRFSLLTLIVAVNVAGVVVWANVRHSARIQLATDLGPVGPTMGWPIVFHDPWGTAYMGTKTAPIIEEVGLFEPVGFCIDLLLFIATVVVAARLTEFLVRKFRKAKRHDG